jgi:PKD repeat protein
MRKLITATVMCVMLLTCLVFTSRAQQSYLYDFRNTLDEVSGTGPSLNALGTGAYVNEALGELSCISRPVYGFTQNSGIQFDNAAAGNFIGDGYSIELYFQFLNNTGFKRIIDFKNQSSDSGLYSTPTTIDFYNEISVGTSAIVTNQYVHLVLTREAANDEVNIYLDGALVGSFIDDSDVALLDASNVLNFFQDDLVFGGEAQPGRIALLRIHDSTLDAAAVSDNFNNLQATSGTLAFSSDISSACLNGNLFNFTNLSNNAGGYTYTWEFGDGNSVVSNDASHSYLTAGLFDVLLIADGAGCTDTVSAQLTSALMLRFATGIQLPLMPVLVSLLTYGVTELPVKPLR